LFFFAKFVVHESPSWHKPAVEGRAGAPALPGHSDINLFRYCQGIIYFDAKKSDRAFGLGMPEQKLNGPEMTRPLEDQRSFCASQRMCPERPWVQPNATNPHRNNARLLARFYAGFGTATTSEQELAGPFVRDL
jgi:hypothetical protein